MGSRLSSRCSPQEKDYEAHQTEKQCYITILEDLQIRSMVSASMFYEQSRKYETYYNYGMVLASIATGLAAAQLSQSIPLATDNYAALAKGILASVTTASTAYKLGSTYILDEWNQKQKQYNEAGAAWQSIELQIRLFLCSSKKETTVKSYKVFTDACIEKRRVICLIARPESSIYEKYHEKANPTLEWYKKKNDIITKIRSQMFEDAKKPKKQ
ncbi:uncharacterized protein LOC124131393 isoform X3 [Haliotis rufescens]|uniref:uncharacterized protein LOC124131393 isoform X3 n=1 Tax=Haliotis rufescens TaxID=6454 RepID=UPI00201F0CD1|nr:uncharacterized protein LOC124131393 isoform X3 [Haliotis rufescens]